MKLKLLSLFLTLFAFSFKSKAQLTADFPDSNFMWNTHNRHTLFEDLAGTEIDGSFYDAGDTVIKNLYYRKVKFRYTYLGRWLMFGPLGYFHGDKLYCLLRNDKLNKRVYTIPQHMSYFNSSSNPDTSEILLYDFNLKVGDVYPLTIDNPQPDSSLYVYAIDTLTDLYNIKRAGYQLSNFGGSIYYNIIQGIGSGAGINNGIDKFEDHLQSTNLVCFKNGNQAMNITNSFLFPFQFSPSTCSKHLYLFVENSISTPINIYPNPTTSEISIIIPEEEATFTLINTLGQSIELKGIRENAQWKFNVSIYPTGIYYIRINTIDNNYYFSSFAKL